MKCLRAADAAGAKEECHEARIAEIDAENQRVDDEGSSVEQQIGDLRSDRGASRVTLLILVTSCAIVRYSHSNSNTC